MDRDYYADLGVSNSASDKEIKAAWKKLASKHHPDRGGSEAEFKKAQEAYDVLSDPKKKSEYDMIRAGGEFGFGTNRRTYYNTSGGYGPFSADVDNLYDLYDMFGRKASTRTRNVIPKLSITLEEAYSGVHKKTSYGNLSIPAGVRTGTRMLLNNSQLVEIVVLPHARYKRANDSLMLTVSINAFDAMLGSKIRISHLDGKKYEVKTPPGIQQGQVIKMSGKGMPNPETSQVGDLLIECKIVTPRLTEKEKSVILQMYSPKTIEV